MSMYQSFIEGESTLEWVDRAISGECSELINEAVEQIINERDVRILKATFSGASEEEIRALAAKKAITDSEFPMHAEWVPEQPDGDEVIRRYRTLDRFISILSKEQLWFSNVDGFSDSLEGTLPDRNTTLEQGLGSWEHRSSRRQRENEHTYINCWRRGEDESAVFWDAYVGDSPGLAIQTTVEDLRSSIELPVAAPYIDYYTNEKGSKEEVGEFSQEYKQELKKVQFGKVEYINFGKNKVPMSMHSYARFFHKRGGFHHEKEFRAVFEDDNASKTTRTVSVDLDNLVNSVILKPGISDEHAALIKMLLDNLNIDAPLVFSELE